MRWLNIVTFCSIILFSYSLNAQEVDTAKGLAAIAKGAIVIDVRTDWEWSAGHHPKALHMQNTQLLDKVIASRIDKDASIVLYCRSGKRAAKSTIELQAAGFTNVINAGGLKDIMPQEE